MPALLSFRLFRAESVLVEVQVHPGEGASINREATEVTAGTSTQELRVSLPQIA